MTRAMIALAVMGLLAGCGASREQLNAKSLEAENYRRQYEDAAKKAKGMEDKLAELAARAEEAEKARAQAEESLQESQSQIETLQQQVQQMSALNSSLAQSKGELEKAQKALEQKSAQYESLAKSLKDEIKSGKIELSELKGRMVVKMKDKILFSSGSTKINPEGQAALAKVAEALKDVQGKIVRVEGHTDNVPTDPKGPFPSNWELSTTRALEVVKLLSDKGVPANKLSAAGYGQHRPIASNKSQHGKSLNRRIEIVLASEDQAPGVKRSTTAKK